MARKSKNTEAEINDEEKKFEQTLRPQKINQFFGQSKITDNLNVFISAALKGGRH
jgi:holliday junction DNA helicase RuvB